MRSQRKNSSREIKTSTNDLKTLDVEVTSKKEKQRLLIMQKCRYSAGVISYNNRTSSNTEDIKGIWMTRYFSTIRK